MINSLLKTLEVFRKEADYHFHGRYKHSVLVSIIGNILQKYSFGKFVMPKFVVVSVSVKNVEISQMFTYSECIFSPFSDSVYDDDCVQVFAMSGKNHLLTSSNHKFSLTL